jgi:hypothetical protein
MISGTDFIPRIKLSGNLAYPVGDSESHLLLTELVVAWGGVGLAGFLAFLIYKQITNLKLSGTSKEDKIAYKAKMKVLLLQLQPMYGAFYTWLGIAMLAFVNYSGFVDLSQLSSFPQVPTWLTPNDNFPEYVPLNIFNFVVILPCVILPLVLTSFSNLLKSGAMGLQIVLGLIWAAGYVYVKGQYWSPGYFASELIGGLATATLIGSISIFFTEVRHNVSLKQRLFMGNTVAIFWLMCLWGIFGTINGVYYNQYNSWFTGLLVDTVIGMAVGYIATLGYFVVYTNEAAELTDKYISKFAEFGDGKAGEITKKQEKALTAALMGGPIVLPSIDLRSKSTKV